MDFEIATALSTRVYCFGCTFVRRLLRECMRGAKGSLCGHPDQYAMLRQVLYVTPLMRSLCVARDREYVRGVRSPLAALVLSGYYTLIPVRLSIDRQISLFRLFDVIILYVLSYDAVGLTFYRYFSRKQSFAPVLTKEYIPPGLFACWRL